jgi:hypothetical protein
MDFVPGFLQRYGNFHHLKIEMRKLERYPIWRRVWSIVAVGSK